MRAKHTELEISDNRFALVRVMLASILLLVYVPQLISHAAVTTSITPTTGTGNLATAVVPPNNNNVYGIRGGTTVGNNLFHSFGQFNVGPGDIARFQTSNLSANAAISNILGRVTGQSASNIFGTIDGATYYPSANVFLMNPYGFLFGPNATVNVGGMMTFTTADYMRLTGDGRFNANPNAIPGDLLTAAPVVAFGFLGPNPAAINFEGGQLTVAEGTGLTLVGGNINLVTDASGTPSSITAHGRPIVLTSVAGPGEVAADTAIPAAGMALGTVTLGQGAILDTTGDASVGDGSGGAISIRGGQLFATGATILTSPAFGSTGQGEAVTMTASDTASLTDGLFIITSSSSPNGDAGAVSITASDVILQDSVIFAEYGGDGTTAGNGGAVTLTGNNNVALTRSGIVTDSTNANGNGGAVSITAPVITLEDSVLFTGMQNFLPLTDTFLGGGGGAVTVSGTSSVSLTNSGIDTSTSFTTGNSGPVTITAPTITMSGVGPLATTVDTSVHSFDMPTAGNGGDILIGGTNVTLSNFATIQSLADSNGSFSKGGTIQINGAESILLDSGTLVRTTSTSQEAAGDVQLTGKHVTITGQSFVASETIGPGGGGTIKITGTENIALGGGSVISTNSGGAVGNEGPAGQIELNTPQLTITGGTIVRSETFGLGPGGTVTVQGTNSPAQSVLIDGFGSGIFTETQGTGAGGSIFVNANSVTMINGATMSASSTGQTENPGNAGSIDITTTNGLTMQNNSKITTEAGQEAGGGNIKITTSPEATVYLQNSTISASVADGPGGGGNVSIDPQFVILQNSQILARAAQGQGGAITIIAGLFLPDATSVVNADSGSGVNGTITIQSPNAPASGRIQPLGKTPLLPTSLLNQRCAALAGGNFSSFTVAGRDSLPAEPGGWLSSSLALAMLSGDTGLEVRGEGEGLSRLSGLSRSADQTHETNQINQTDQTNEPPMLSLRQIAPPGFLTQTFAVDWSGCTS